MLTWLWLKGLLVRYPARLIGAAVGVALTVALLASIGVFINSSAASMTQRAIAEVPVDWQIQLASDADPNAAIASIGQATPYTALEIVGYADVAGFTASSPSDNTGLTVQTTGPGKVLGLGPKYRQLFPGQLRPLIGAADGVLLAQQTAANLHATPGARVTLQRLDLPPVTVTVAGVVDLPNADALFQAVGVPTGLAPSAPPDNVLLLPSETWHQIFDPQAAVRPASVRAQLHLRINHALPADPGAALIEAQALARNVEARLAGAGSVADNLAARLEAVHADALYARVLFLFLGLPGVVLAVLLTLSVSASGAEHRRKEQALLRARGASLTQILSLQSLEALATGTGGAGLGLGLAYLAARAITPGEAFTDRMSLMWAAWAALLGLILAVVAALYPAWLQARRSTVVAARAVIGRGRAPLWQRLYLDGLLLAASAMAFWQAASTGYQVVLAPEGTPQVSVAYQAFIAPVCLWIGGSLLLLRWGENFLGRERRLLAMLLRPLARGLSGVAAASLQRQRALIIRGAALVALALSFAVSTAVFNTTYNAQARLDAELTNGADVTLIGSTASPPSQWLAELKALPGVAGLQPMQHRFAYVGNDLQDIYGIDPQRLREATNLSDAFFEGHNADATLAALARQADGVLVSEETVRDYQLRLGDQLNLRLQSAHNHQYHVAPFHFVGVVREFPTAPKDSFLVVNAAYLTQMTGSDAAEIVLIRAGGSPGDLVARVRAVVGSLAGVQVSDLGMTQHALSSNLTAVDLRGLTRLELAFAVLLAAGATGLVLALGLAERRRAFTILSALGARPGQLGAFLWSEGLVILAGGGVIGVAIGLGVAQMLVKLLTQVFDPPPESLSVPWVYLAVLLVAATTSTVAAVLSMQWASRRTVVEALRDI